MCKVSLTDVGRVRAMSIDVVVNLMECLIDVQNQTESLFGLE